MQLREITEQDLEKVRVLRNENREWFFNSAYLTAEQQQNWYRTKPDTFRLYVIEEDGEIVGTIGLKEFQDEIEVGNLTMAESYRGKGLMKKAIQQLTADGRQYFANILPHNANSLRVFERAGFSLRSSSADMIVVSFPANTRN